MKHKSRCLTYQLLINSCNPLFPWNKNLPNHFLVNPHGYKLIAPFGSNKQSEYKSMQAKYFIFAGGATITT